MEMPEIKFKKSKKEGKTTRVMSLSMVAAYLDVSHDKIRVWLRDGLPYEKEPVKRGESYQFDIADVHKWVLAYERALLEEKFTEAAAMSAKAGSAPGGGETKEEADRRKAIAQANIAEIEEAKEAGAVVPIDVVITMVTDDYAQLRAGLESLGNQLADRTAPITNPAQVQTVADKLVRKTVSKLVPRIPGITPDDEDDDVEAAAA
jgi:hypothetical protein